MLMWTGQSLLEVSLQGLSKSVGQLVGRSVGR